MPVEHHNTFRAGTTRRVLLFYAADATLPAAGRRGLAPHTPGASAAYLREGESVARPVQLVPGRAGEWVAGSLAEVDPELMPGVYQFGAPDEMLAAGSTRVLLLLRFAGALVAPIEVSLVAYDPQDSERMGVSSLANSKRHEFLRRAMPRLSELDLTLGERAEGALRRSLAGRDGEEQS